MNEGASPGRTASHRRFSREEVLRSFSPPKSQAVLKDGVDLFCSNPLREGRDTQSNVNTFC